MRGTKCPNRCAGGFGSGHWRDSSQDCELDHIQVLSETVTRSTFVSVALNIADLVEHAIDLVPERVALASDGREVTYAQLEERANRLAHYLREQGVKPGDKVGIYSRNTIEAVEAMIAVFKIRAIMINVNYRYVENELQYIFDNSDMVALVHERRYSDKVANVLPNTPLVKTVVVVEDGTDVDFSAYSGIEYEAALAQSNPERDFEDRSADDIYMLYTGGTTGHPKGVMWRHEDVWRVLGGGINFMTGEWVKDEWQLAKEGAENPGLVRYPIPPMIHGGAQWALFQSLFSGGKVVMHPEFSGHEVWRIIDDHKVNVIFITGDAMARPMLDALEEATRPPVSPTTSRPCSPWHRVRPCSPRPSRTVSSTCCPARSSPTPSARPRPASVASASREGQDPRRRPHGEDRRVDHRPRRRRQPDRTGFRKGRHGRAHRQHPARLLQGRSQDQGDLPRVQRDPLLDPR